MKIIRVVVGDDDPNIRAALTEVLHTDPRFSVVGAAATGEEVLAMVSAVGPDVVLLDVRMPGGGPVAAAALAEAGDLASRGAGHDGTPVVVAVSAQTSVATVVAMLRAGAVGFFRKGNLDALPELVARCAGGEVVLAVPSGAAALRQLVRSARVGEE